MNLCTAFIILITIFILYKLYEYYYNDNSLTYISINGQLIEMEVSPFVKKMNKELESEEVKQLLNTVNDKVNMLINYLDNKYKQSNNITIINGINMLKNNYKYENLIEHVPKWHSPETSYTINKGEILALCLRHKDIPQKFHDINVIMFVTVHELAHIFSESLGHTDEFWTNFKFLLNESIKLGIYNFEDYSKQNKHYCGMDINYTPITDFTLVNLI